MSSSGSVKLRYEKCLVNWGNAIVEALRLALEGAEKLEAAMVQVESLKPAVEFVERLGCLRNILKIRDPTSSIPSRRSPRAPLGCPRMIEGGA